MTILTSSLTDKAPLESPTFTGNVTIPDLISHTGNSISSFGFPADNLFIVNTSGSERVRVDSSGNVGIGQTAPTTLLEVGDCTASAQIDSGNIAVRTKETTDAAIVIQEAIGTEQWALGVNSAGDLLFINSGVSADVTFADNGSVGIGTNAPESKLHISGTGPQKIIVGSSSNNIDDSGTFLASETGEVMGAGLRYDALSNRGGLFGRENQINSDIMTWSRDGTDIQIRTSGQDRVSIIADGKVGLNRTNPFAGIHVDRNITYPNAVNGSADAWNNIDKSQIRISAGNNGMAFGLNFSENTRQGFIQVGHDNPGFANAAGDLCLQPFVGNVGIGTSTPSEKLSVNGNVNVVGLLTATTKAFTIDHPTKPDHKLRYGSLEGPENGVYVRGKLTDRSTIELPDYWTELVDSDSISVSLTAIGSSQLLYVADISNNTITIATDSTAPINCFYTVFAERKDVDPLTVEFKA